jgi:hypothetical protein
MGRARELRKRWRTARVGLPHYCRTAYASIILVRG